MSVQKLDKNHKIKKTSKKVLETVGSPQLVPQVERLVDERITELQDVLDTLEEGKVDKEEGKGLSSNDFTDYYKNTVDNMVQSLALINQTLNLLQIDLTRILDALNIDGPLS